MEDGCHAFFEAESLEDVCCSAGETDCGTEEGYAEEGHFSWDGVSRDRYRVVLVMLVAVGCGMWILRIGSWARFERDNARLRANVEV